MDKNSTQSLLMATAEFVKTTETVKQVILPSILKQKQDISDISDILVALKDKIDNNSVKGGHDTSDILNQVEVLRKSIDNIDIDLISKEDKLGVVIETIVKEVEKLQSEINLVLLKVSKLDSIQSLKITKELNKLQAKIDILESNMPALEYDDTDITNSQKDILKRVATIEIDKTTNIAVVDYINTQDEIIEAKTIKGLIKAIDTIASQHLSLNNKRGTIGVDILNAGAPLRASVTRINFTGATLTDTNGTINIPLGGGTPAAPINSVQFNNMGAFGGSSSMTYVNNVLLLNQAGTGITLTNPLLQATNSVNNFTQLAIQNKSNGTNASADIIAYYDGNTDDITGFANMGVAGSGFSQTAYAITSPGDAYLFGSAFAGSGKKGNMILATDSTGTENEIVLATGGFNSLTNERIRIRLKGGIKFGTTVTSNIFVNGGSTSLGTVVADSNSIAIGNGALLYTNTALTTLTNIGVGLNALQGVSGTLMTGTNNIGIGTNTLKVNTTGLGNIAIGLNASSSNAVGIEGVAIGTNALASNVAGSRGLAIGFESQRYTNSTAVPFNLGSVSIGYQALRGSTTASANTGTANMAVGYQTLFNNTTGGFNLAIGSQALLSNLTGNDNVALGSATLSSLTTGSQNVALGSSSLLLSNGSRNIAIGYVTGFGISTGSDNIFIGTSTANDISTGNGNTVIGGNVTGLTAGLTNNIVLANGIGTIRLQVDNNGVAKFTAGLITPYVAKTTTYTVLRSDYTVDCISGTFNVTLPTAIGFNGQIYNIKNSGAGTITVDTTSSQTIDGALTKTLAVQYNGFSFQSNGSNWIII